VWCGQGISVSPTNPIVAYAPSLVFVGTDLLISAINYRVLNAVHWGMAVMYWVHLLVAHTFTAETDIITGAGNSYY